MKNNKKILFNVLALCVSAVFYSCTQENAVTVNQVRMNWHYDVPATKYWESLPIGTGRFGAMIPGSID
ncbi:MAG: glycoside hydrolase family 95 protein, partial [Prevotellaceae bacterium]|nr:glycoside hydrolase family 95 protein [Prevotellaceae bacterium]